MKVNISKEWMQANAAKEEGMEIGAGSPPRSMDEAAMREQFEAWVEANGPISSEITYRDITTGQYILYSTQLAWEAWQASRKQVDE